MKSYRQQPRTARARAADRGSNVEEELMKMFTLKGHHCSTLDVTVAKESIAEKVFEELYTERGRYENHGSMKIKRQ